MNRETTDQELIDYMRESITVQQWNERREELKEFRDQQWISTNLDCSGLINKRYNKQTAL